MAWTTTYPDAERMVHTSVPNLREFLRKTTATEIILRTSRVAGCWHDNEFDAHRAGFDIYRFFDKELDERGEFCECYLLEKRA